MLHPVLELEQGKRVSTEIRKQKNIQCASLSISGEDKNISRSILLLLSVI